MFSTRSPQNLGDLFLEELAANLTTTHDDDGDRPTHDIATIGKHLFKHDPARHHVEWLEALEQHNRLIIIAPPDSAKTTWTQAALATYIGNNPTSTNAIISAQAEQARERVTVIKELIEDADSGWRDLFPDVTPGRKWTDNVINVNLHPRQKPTPTLFGAGALAGRSIGKRIDGVLLIDDIHDQKNSETPKQRAKIVRWVRETMLSRLTDSARCWVIGTPWADGDVLDELTKIGFVVIRTPAINERGASYWPERWSLDKLAEKQKEVGKGSFDAMYLLKKKLLGRKLFKREMFEILDDRHIPTTFVKIGRYWDLAATDDIDGGEPAYTAGVKIAVDARKTIYILDVKRFRKGPDDVLKEIEETARIDGHDVEIFAEQEPGSSGKTVIDVIRRRLAGYTFRGDKPTGSKVRRADAVVSYAEGGAIKLRRGHWNDEYLNELEAFPDGDFKDMTDATSGGFKRIVLKSGGMGSTA